MSDAILTLEHIDKSFPVSHSIQATLRSFIGKKTVRRQVLFDLSLEVHRGELFGLLGPNGAGKSTLLKLLSTLILPDHGKMHIDGIDVAAHPLEAKRRIALCTSDERSFYFRLTARQNLEFFGSLMGLAGARLRRRIEECVALVDLNDFLDERFGGFSSGMRVRLTVARALLADPAVIFFDEPTRAVDPVHAEDVRTLIRRDLVENAGKTVVLATNLLEEAWDLCDRIGVVNHGRIVALGPPRDLGAGLSAHARYSVTIESVDETVLARLRVIPELRDLRVEVATRGFHLSIQLERSEGSLGRLMLALSSAGVHVRDFRPVDPEPIDFFKGVTADSNEA